ncbi:cilia- and flagella-associated protein HOATZ-like [Tubulanus polymorphus]|uniref:cilia- and flagella-associated protein HOATZ-like n=1 Tax=Tubulanus polymorphus TaxID=672921 RepID=UPI003DA25555
MAATTVVNLGMPRETTEFSGSSQEDVVHAKNFWQSLQLHPPMESRLVSSDIRQRLKKAPVGRQPKNYVYVPIQEDEKLKNFLLKAKHEEHQVQMKRIRELALKKQETRSLLSAQRVHRMQQELISNHVGLKPIDPPRSGPARVTPTDEINPQDCLKQLDEFDENRTLENTNKISS